MGLIGTKPFEEEDTFHIERHAFLTGPQLIVRLLLAQRHIDQAWGINSAGFVSGYRGSPLGGLDLELWNEQNALTANGIRFLPAINEDLAATAILGTQRIGSDPHANYDGVFSLWYGKGPGVDRSGDALKHGNAYGTSPKGGVLVVAGDDHGCISSSMPHQSDQAFMAWHMPIVSPASLSEYMEFGLYGWALSRFSGNWVGFKAISETVESAASIKLSAPKTYEKPSNYVYPSGGVHYRWPDFPSLAIEERLFAKLNAVAAFAKLNSIDKHVVSAPHAHVGIVTCGKAHLDLMEALRLLDLTVVELESLGIRIYKVGLSYPIETTRIDAFVSGLQHVLVVEEKGPVVEQQIKTHLFNVSSGHRPLITGKTDEHGRPYIPATGELTPSILLPLLESWLHKHIASRQFAAMLPQFASNITIRNGAEKRAPYFCSGCPHNLSTKVPDGSVALAGIGCHFMASWMNRGTTGLTQMGGEGADWVGQSLFTKTPHVFQNLGDGTYFHSGYLALRQAVAAHTNITYKILYNDAVAMTGGQPIDGKLTVPQIAKQVADEGVQTIVIVADDLGRYRSVNDLPSGVAVHHRDELDAVQRKLREVPGVSVLIYDQMCAAEKRRRRKRGEIPEDRRSVLINPAVCEGCGDCGTQSNCVSILPLETEFGRKRTIDQSCCNQDFSCIKGFCPSFVSVVGGTRKQQKKSEVHLNKLREALELHAKPKVATIESSYNLLIAGIGGTGVVTVGAIIAMAAHHEGKGVSTLNFKGFAQKGGALLNHIRLAPTPEALNFPVRIDHKQADVVLVCDVVVGTSDDVLNVIRKGHTKALINQGEIVTGKFTQNPDAGVHVPELVERLRHAVGQADVSVFDAQHYARLAFNDTIVINMMMAGYAWQRGGIPIEAESIEWAIEQNGVAVELNRKAFLLGRLLAADETSVRGLLGQKASVIQFFKKTPLEIKIASWADFLRRYQNDDYAQHYMRRVKQIEAIEKRMRREDNTLPLTDAIAKHLFKLMAYKDEYEVARLFTDGTFETQVRQQFEGNYTMEFYMAPPVLSLFSKNKMPKKIRFGSSMMTAMRLLAKLKFLRGTLFDPFGYLAERRVERKLIDDYDNMIGEFITSLTPDNLSVAIELANLPASIRGYGHIKLASVEKIKSRREMLLEAFRKPSKSDFRSSYVAQ